MIKREKSTKGIQKDPGFDARNLALDLLVKVEREASYANLIVPAELRKSSLEPRDSAFVTELVYGTLRQRILYDAIIEAAAGRKTSKIDVIPLTILRLTAHQLLSLNTPAHAAVDSAVRLTVRNRSGSASGFVNAISRRISERSLDAWIELLTSQLDENGRLALIHSHPRWIVEAYVERLGDINRVTEELRANNINPKVTGIIYPGSSWSDETLSTSNPCEWVPEARYLTGNPERILEIRKRVGGIQDQGSYLVASALAAVVVDPGRGSSNLWLDMCAGPGGKAALLSRWAHSLNKRFLALEISEHRAELIRRVAHEIVVADSAQAPISKASVERILLDAPCSGLGALRRRPDARHRKTLLDIKALVELQRNLLASAHELLEEGGVLGYVTCSPVSAETEGNTRWFCESFPDMDLIDARPYFPPQMELGERFDVQLWPGVHHTDAMYVAMFRKKTSTR